MACLRKIKSKQQYFGLNSKSLIQAGNVQFIPGKGSQDD
jgi:hypothetical protein